MVQCEPYVGAYKSAKVSFNLETLRLVMADIPLICFEREDTQLSGDSRRPCGQGNATPNTSVRDQKMRLSRGGRCDTANGSI